eukprot:CAMPEP_0201687176 /NCGR_PEP_ID=MMETSP0578-20130828/1345_1 /ASSEMBLY_ACC=CAM_ASM_000663 /TAXON_ID=267565 /ORGANISM="Skeletonema grethea, Strain CCMP 1804" /LENGTH=526 /DNA_ID=CAMNT_0048171307 /DNA_START=42 /DNA_END=1622 /DNA_ORIENTATION=-
MMNNQQYLEAMGRLQRSSQFASLMTPSSFSSTSAGVIPQAAAVPQQQQQHDAAATSNALNNQIATNLTGPSPRPLWRNGEKTFPYKVYDMLEFAESSGSTDICSWLPSGDSFVIHDRKLFTEFILPRFFLHKKWRSFTRQLNIWCFKRDFSVTVSDAYCHPFFKRGDVAKLCCVERAESKNLFKKCPLTNKRKPPKTTPTDGASSSSTTTTKPGGENQSIKKGSVVTSAASDAVAIKKRRVSSTTEEEDVMDVASFLAGLKSNPKTSSPKTTAASAPEESPSLVEKPVEGGASVSSSNNSSKGVDQKKAEAVMTSRIQLMPRQTSQVSLPFSDHSQGAVTTSSIASLPQAPSVQHTRVSNLNMVDGNNAAIAMNNQTMNNQTFPMNSTFHQGTFDRETLRRLSTDQLVALASRMKLREQMLRERAMSMQPVMAAPTMASVAAQGPTAGWRDNYQEMLVAQQQALQQQQQQQQHSRSLGGIPSQGMLTQGMVHSLMGSTKPKPSYGDVAEMGGIPNISQNFGYPRAA